MYLPNDVQTGRVDRQTVFITSLQLNATSSLYQQLPISLH